MVQKNQDLQTRRVRRWWRWLLDGLTVLLLSVLLFCLSLPRLLEKKIQGLLDGLSEKERWQLSISRVGLFTSDFRLLVENPADLEADPCLAIEAGQLFYRPLALLRGEIALLRLNGIQAELRWQDGRWRIPASDNLRQRPAAEAAPAPIWNGPRPWLERLAALPVKIKELSLNGLLRLHWEEEQHLLPFRGQILNPQKSQAEEIKLAARGFLGGNAFQGQITLRPPDGYFTLAADIILQTASLPQPWQQNLPPQTALQANLQAEGQWQETEILPEQLKLELPLQISMQGDDWQLSGQPRLTLNRAGESWRLQLQNLFFSWRRQDFALRLVEIDFNPRAGHLRGDLYLTQANLPEQQLTLKGDWLAPPPTAGMAEQLQALFHHHNKLKLQLSAADKDRALNLNLSDQEFSFHQPELSLTRNAAEHPAIIEVTLRVEEFSLQQQEYHLTGRQLETKINFAQQALSLHGTLEDFAFARGDDGQAQISRLTIDGESSGENRQLRLKATELAAAVKPEIQLQLPEFNLQLTGMPGDKHEEWHYAGRLTWQKGQLQERQANLAVEEISADLPFCWPLTAPAPEARGYLKLGQLNRGEETLGYLDLHCDWENLGWQIQGEAVLLGLQAVLTGKVAAQPDYNLQAETRIQLPQQPLSDNLLLQKWLPEGDDLELAAEIAGETFLRWDSGQLTGEMSLQLSELSAISAARGLSLQGGRLSLAFPRLPAIETAGSQRLSCRELKIGRLQFGRGVAQFRIDNPRLAYLESLRLDWCDGTIRTSSIKISPDSERLQLTLYGDRLLLPTMLAQFGFGSTEGEGRISGSLPMHLSPQNIRFREGFLYSTPGETGQLKLQPSALISSTAASSEQMQLALAALQDFSYNWVRLALNTDAEALQLNLQLDGKPNQRLYFRPQGGGFSKSEVANEFQGLTLNLNIRVPLQEFLHQYGNWQKLSH